MKTQWSRPHKVSLRLVISGAICVALLLTAGLITAQAKPPHMLTGGAYFYVPDWGGVEIWTTVDVREIDPTTGAAKGSVQATVYDPSAGWKSLVFVPDCVKFEDRMVTMVLEVTQKTGVGNGEVGEHAKWQIYDGGIPGAAKDTWTIKNYQLDPWIEYWPADVPAPDCSSFDADPDWEPPLYVTHGNLTVH